MIGVMKIKIFIFRIFFCTVSIISLFCNEGCYSRESSPLVQSLVTTDMNHSHENDISFNLIDKGVRKFLLKESAGHSHDLILAEEDVANLNLGQEVQLESETSQFHSHKVTIQKLEF